jgi:VanZ family protein
MQNNWRRSGVLVAFLSVVAITALSLVPGSLRPHTGLCGQTEHFIAYAGAGFLFSGCLTSPWRRALGWSALALAAGCFELLQTIIPDRSPSVLDALASIAGMTVGMATSAILLRLVAKPGLTASAAGLN